nr:unnamed protein product [Spirometra erinaceieuropaei]
MGGAVSLAYPLPPTYPPLPTSNEQSRFSAPSAPASSNSSSSRSSSILLWRLVLAARSANSTEHYLRTVISACRPHLPRQFFRPSPPHGCEKAEKDLGDCSTDFFDQCLETAAARHRHGQRIAHSTATGISLKTSHSALDLNSSPSAVKGEVSRRSV